MKQKEMHDIYKYITSIYECTWTWRKIKQILLYLSFVSATMLFGLVVVLFMRYPGIGSSSGVGGDNIDSLHATIYRWGKR